MTCVSAFSHKTGSAVSGCNLPTLLRIGTLAFRHLCDCWLTVTQNWAITFKSCLNPYPLLPFSFPLSILCFLNKIMHHNDFTYFLKIRIFEQASFAKPHKIKKQKWNGQMEGFSKEQHISGYFKRWSNHSSDYVRNRKSSIWPAIVLLNIAFSLQKFLRLKLRDCSFAEWSHRKQFIHQ